MNEKIDKLIQVSKDFYKVIYEKIDKDEDLDIDLYAEGVSNIIALIQIEDVACKEFYKKEIEELIYNLGIISFRLRENKQEIENEILMINKRIIAQRRYGS